MNRKNYKLFITDKSQNASKELNLSSIEDIINFINDFIYSVVNKRLYDDDLPSIFVEYDKKSMFCHYSGNNNWKVGLLSNEQKELNWEQLLEQWSYLFDKVNTTVILTFYRIDKLHLDDLETQFERSMHIKRSANTFALIIL
jgi:hypothetical protein